MPEPSDTQQFRRIALRDGALMATTSACWLWLDPAQSTYLVWFTAALTLASAFVFHEWGHLLGARISQARVYPPTHLASIFLYNFDAELNSRRQFLWTSILGFVATGLFLAIFFFGLPATHPATALVQIGALGLAGLTVVFEFPIAIAVALGRPIPQLKLFADRRSRANPEGRPGTSN